MTRNRLITVLAALAVVGIVVVIPVVGQGGIGGQLPPEKKAFEATAQAIQTKDAAAPRAAKTTPLPPPASCQGPSITGGIDVARPDGPPDYRRLVNRAYVLRGDIYYVIWAGAPYDAPQQGLIRVEQSPVDPCAAVLAGKTTPPAHDFILPKGPLTITQIDGDSVIFSIAGDGTDSFNFVTGQFALSTPVPLQPLPTLAPTPSPRLPTPKPYP
jgi:hypothetical protein